MAAHQGNVVRPQRSREVASLIDVRDEQVRIAEFVTNIPHGNFCSDSARAVKDGLQFRRLADAERQHVLGVGVHDRVDVRPRLVDRTVDETLAVEVRLANPRDIAGHIVFQDVVGFDDLRAARTREQVRAGLRRMTDAHVSVRIEHVFVCQDAVGQDQIADRDGQWTISGWLFHFDSPGFKSAAISRSMSAGVTCASSATAGSIRCR